MRRVELLIEQIRRTTDNNDVNGIGDNEILQYLNDGQDRLQAKIQKAHPESEIFTLVGYKTLTSGVDTYDLTTLEDSSGDEYQTRLLVDSAISMVEQSSNNNDTTSFYPINNVGIREKTIGWGYFLRAGNIVISPIPDSGRLRIHFTARLNELDKRRGKISSVTSGVSIGLDAGTIPTDTDFNNIDYCCVVDKDGALILGNIAIDSYSSPTISTTNTLAGVTTDHYVLYGKFATTNSALQDIAERYLIEYGSMRIFMKDSSRDITVSSQLVQEIEKDLIDLYADPGADAQMIPILTTDYLNF